MLGYRDIYVRRVAGRPLGASIAASIAAAG
jgi:hypothetical protein